MKKLIFIFLVFSIVSTLDAMMLTTKLPLSSQILENGLSALKKKDYEKAVSYLSSAAALTSDMAIKDQALYYLGYAYSKQKNWQKAEETYSQLLKTTSNPRLQAKASLALAKVLFYQKRYRAAQAYLNNPLQSDDPAIVTKAQSLLERIIAKIAPQTIHDISNQPAFQGEKRGRNDDN